MQQEKIYTEKDMDTIAASSYLNGHNAGYEEAKYEFAARSAIWEKASTKRPQGWQLTRIINSEKRFPVKFSLHVIADVAGKTYDPQELEYLSDESPSKEGNKEREEIERRNRLLENNLKLGMRLNRPGISEQEQEETWQDYKRRNNL